MTPEEAKEFLRMRRSRGRPPAEEAAKLEQAKEIVAQNPTPLKPKRVRLKRRRNPVADETKPKKRRGRPPKPKSEKADKPKKQRGRPKGSKDTSKRRTKVTAKTKKKNKLVEFPLAQHYVDGGKAALVKAIAGMDDKELRKAARLTIKAAREVIEKPKKKGRPSPMYATKRLVAAEIVNRASNKKGRGSATAKLPAKGGKRSRLRAGAGPRPEIFDKIKRKRRKRRKMTRTRTRASKRGLPNKKKDSS